MLDREMERTYRAERVFEATLHEPVLGDLAGCLSLLETIVPPVTMSRVTLRALPARQTTYLGRLDYAGWYRWEVGLMLPVSPFTVVHEAAHVLVETIGAPELHNHDFRTTMLWLTRQVYGVRAARRLQGAYTEEHLSC